jgi:hypothetical protein
MKLLHRVLRIFSDKGLLLTLVLSIALMCFFYGKLLLHPGKTYFGASGDGMQIYYETIYHIKYDHEYWRQNSVNYPYGESIFFTGAMPFVNNVAKLFGPGAASFGIALINLLMILSPVIGALFLYGIFRHLRLPWIYGGVSASAIAFLSPQVYRFFGHYSLAWIFLLPAMIFMLLRFYDYPSLRNSFAIGFLAFLGATTHLYFLAFFGLLGGFYWSALFISRDRGFGRFTFVLKHFTIQFILPFVLIQAITMMTDHVSDRTAAPWGFLTYHSNKAGVFFPFGKPYEAFFRRFIEPEQVEPEGMAYTGLAAMAGLVVIIFVQLFRMIRSIIRTRQALDQQGKTGRATALLHSLLRFLKIAFSVTDSKVLNIFFWTSLAVLWFSFGNPFIGGHEDWVVNLGPLRQFRAIGRFTWIFFYVVNIVAVYRVYKVVQQKKFLRIAVMIILPAMLLYDMYYTVNGHQDQLNNRIAELEDETNQLPQDQWLREFNPASYQAILPLPYFHSGAENITRITSDPEIVKCAFIVSLKTGLPMMSVASARTSISQTKQLVQLVLDPLRPLQVLNDLPDQRPLLLVVRPATLDYNEKRILSLATPVAVSNDYQLYSLLPSALEALQRNEYSVVKAGLDTCKRIPAGPFITNDSSFFFLYRNYDQYGGKPYTGKGSLAVGMREHTVLLDTMLRVPGEYLVSYWVNHVDRDLYPRANIEVGAVDSAGTVPPFYAFFNIYHRLQAIDGSWGLVEFPLTLPAPCCHVMISTWNNEMKKNDVMEIDDFMIRPLHTDLYLTHGDTIIRNNRIYYPSK